MIYILEINIFVEYNVIYNEFFLMDNEFLYYNIIYIYIYEFNYSFLI